MGLSDVTVKLDARTPAPQPVKSPTAHPPAWCMRLASGVRIGLRSASELEQHWVEHLAKTMCLEVESPDDIIMIGTAKDGARPSIGESPDATALCLLHPGFVSLNPGSQRSVISAMVAAPIIEHGAFLLHAGLATWQGKGVLFAAPGDGGKTTTCARLPAPWQVLSDDACLISWDLNGRPWAHPWPTWSRFDHNGPGGQWSFGKAVPLHYVCFLGKSEQTRLRPLEVSEASCGLLESAEQITQSTLLCMAKENARDFRSKRLKYVIELARSVPSGNLQLSLTGDFSPLVQSAVSANAGLGTM